MKDTFVSSLKDKEITWYIVDAADKTLGRLSTEIAKVLLGKNQVTYAPYTDSKNYVIIINAEKITVTGKKKDQKLYYRHSGTPGGLKIRTFLEVEKLFPEKILELSIKRMLPKGALRNKLFKRLKVYAGMNHPHISQKPKSLEF
jgi:large subunit ribosomal protein L13